MYKDKAKQREANKAAKQRFKLKQAKKNAPALRRMDELGAEGIPVGGIPKQGIPKGIPKDDKVIIPVGPGPVIDNMPELPANFGQPDCACLHCRSNRSSGSKATLNHGQYKAAAQLDLNEYNRVSLPGDVDYNKPARIQ